MCIRDRVYYICNAATQRGEMELTDAADYVTAIEEHSVKMCIRDSFYIDDVLYIRSLHPLSEDYIHTTRCPYQIVPDMRQITKKKGCPTKILIAGQPELLTNLWQQGIKQFGERLYITKSHVHFLEFLNPAVSKGKGVAKLGEILKIPYSQRLVIGDNLNDRELFSGGAVKIAMGNGVQELKDLATWVAPPNDADGWAKAMSRWVFQETIS